MTLLDSQFEFTRLVAKLINYAYAQGYTLTLGEAYRPKEMAEIYAKNGMGISNSLHTDRLAIDLNLFMDGKNLTSKEAWWNLGEYWESLTTQDYTTCWGGRFTRVDANHFSLAYGGRK